MAANMNAVAAATLNKWTMIESLAYTLKTLSGKQAWQPEAPGKGWELLPWGRCCKHGRLPAGLLEAMKLADAER